MKLVVKVLQLFFGLFLYALGIVITINANIGLAPWDVFHQGLGFILNTTMGFAGIGVGFILILINLFLKERVGWGTIANMIFIGLFLDIIMKNNWIPVFHGLFFQFFMACVGLFIIGVASVFYIRTGLGAGPRDALMIALKKKTGKSVQFIRNSIEIAVLVLGYLLGGFVGIGTIFMSLSVGFFVQLAFKLFHFDVNSIEHRTIDADIKWLKYTLLSSKDDLSSTKILQQKVK